MPYCFNGCRSIFLHVEISKFRSHIALRLRELGQAKPTEIEVIGGLERAIEPVNDEVSGADRGWDTQDLKSVLDGGGFTA